MHDIAHRPLAIVGMACRLPGADNLDEYWDLLVEGRSGLGELPPERFDRRLYYDPRKGQRTKSYTTLGGVVRQRPFDRTACPLPQSLIDQSHEVHLALCEVAADACRHAGMDPFNLPTRNVGVYVGHTPPNALSGNLLFARRVGETAQYLREVAGFDELTGGQQEAVIAEIIEEVRRDFPPEDSRFQVRSNAFHVAALITRGFGLDGPSMAFDAACASSLRAFGHAVRAMQLGQIEMAIVGGASLCHADSLILFSQAQSVSAYGSRPFDKHADGLVAAEGYISIVIKPLDRAVSDGDDVLAVIRGVGTSSDGRGKSLWAPRKEGQVEAVRRAYGPGISVEELQYIEMHATSTQVGDATEMSALIEVLGDKLPSGSKIAVGSVKANVGHTLESAGLASLVKTVLSMRHGIIPPQINVETLNDKIPWDDVPFFVPQTGLRWDPPGPNKARRAAVNAFGIGGLNVHVVLDDSVTEECALSRTGISDPAATSEQKLRAGIQDRSSAGDSSQQPADEPIAIIGVGAVFPGARTVEALLEVLRNGTDQTHSVPAEPWMQYVDVDAPSERRWRVAVRHAGYITDFNYDWKKHRIPPKQLTGADPLQYMLLDAADQALKDAGYGEKPYDKTRTGTIVGTIFGGEFTDQLTMGLRLSDFQDTLSQLLRRRGVAEADIERVAAEYEEILLKHMPALIDETGSFTCSTLASRITKTFDLMGGAVAVDAGGASSMAALNCCIDLLRAGDCDMMLCAAGQRAMSCSTYAFMSQTGQMASGAAAGPFDADARGCVPGECVGVLVLKRLSDARRDGDNVRGVIYGMGVARDQSLEESLGRAVGRAMKSTRVRPEQVALVEAGAIGTPTLDHPELDALARTYGPRDEPLLLSAASAQFGYTGGGSGVASLLKALAELGDVSVPAIPKLARPAPQVAAHGDVFRPPREPSALPALNEDGRVLAAVDSFSDFNLAYHVILEGPVRLPKKAESTAPAVVAAAPEIPDTAPWRIVRVGAASLEELLSRLGRAEADSASLFSLSRGQSFQPKHRSRLAVVAGNSDELATKLRLAAGQLLRAEARPLLAERGIFYGQPGGRPPRVAFLFPGQGSQYADMLRALVEEFPPAKEALRQVEAVLSGMDVATFRQMAWEQGERLASDLWATQLALLAANTIMHYAVAALGLRADRLAGHSFGELAALVAAGSWTFRDALRATLARCAAIEACRNARGLMLSTTAPADVVEPLCREIGDLYVSHYNAPDQTVAGGREEPVHKLAEAITARNYQTKILKVPGAFHTPLMQDVKEPFGRGLAEVPLEPPRIPLLSSVTNRYVAEPAEIRDNLVVQLTAPIHYAELVTRLAEEGVTVFVEVGPKQVLTGLHKRIFNDDRLTLLSCDHKTRGGLQQLCCVRAALETTGALDPRFDGSFSTAAYLYSTPAPQAAAPETARDASPRKADATVAIQPSVAPEEQAPTDPAVRAAESIGSQSPNEPTVPAPAVTGADSQAASGGSVRLEKHNGLNVLRLAGTPFGMGLQQGRAQAREIRKVLRRYADQAGTKWDSVLDVDAAAEHAEAFFSPDELQELQGIAKGADVTVESVVAHNLRLYLDAGAGGIHFAFTAECNPEQGLLHAANEDLQRGLSVGDCLERNIQVRRPTDGIGHLAFGVAGQVGCLNGLNAAGLAVSTSALLDVPRLTDGEPARLHTVVVKQLLQRAADLDAALEIIREMPKRGAWSLCLSHHPTDRLCYVEFDGRQLKVQPAPLIVAAANHRLLNGDSADAPAHSRRRLKRLQSLLSGENRKRVTPQRAQEILRDRFDLRRGRELPSATLSTVCRVDNQISIVMQPAQGDLWVTTGPLSNGHQSAFRHLKIHKLLDPDTHIESGGAVQAPTVDSPPPETEQCAAQAGSENAESLASQPAASTSSGRAGTLRPASAVTNEELAAAYAGSESIEQRTVCARHVLRVVPAPLAADVAPLQLAGAAIVLGDNPAAVALRDRLQQLGAAVYLLPVSDDIDDVLAALERCWQSGPAPHLFLMTACDADADLDLNEAAWNRRRLRGVLLPYRVCQKWFELVSQAGLLPSASLLAATSLGGDLGLSGQVRNVESGALCGLLKAVRLELQIGQKISSFRARVVDAEESLPPAQRADSICRELAAADDEVEVGYNGGRRYVVRPLPQSTDYLPQAELPRGANVVITGGARGITAVVARELGARFGLILNLIGSSPRPEIPDGYRDLSPEELKELRATIMKEALAEGRKPAEAWAGFEKALEIDRTLRELAAAGISARYHSCDVGDRQALARVLEQIRAADGPIRGVVHGAGFERAARFEKKQPALVERTLAAKVDGAAALMQFTRSDPLEFFAAFGSVSGRFGGVGQTDYCAANEMLAKLVDWFRHERPDCRATHFHWHAWDGVGMAVRPESQHIRKLHAITFMPPEQGAEHLLAELQAQLPESEVLVTELSYCRRHFAPAPAGDNQAARRPTSTAGTSQTIVEGGERPASAAPPGAAQSRATTDDATRAGSPRTAATLHSAPRAAALDTSPLLDALPEHVAGQKLTAEVQLDPTADVFLAQHRFKDRPMMPVVVTLEALAEAGALLAAQDRRVTGLRDVRILNGLRFFNDEPLTARVHAEVRGSDVAGRFTCDFYNRSGKLLLPDKPYLECAVETGPQAPALEAPLPGEPREWTRCWYPDEDIVIWHGPVYRCLYEMAVEGDQAWGHLRAPAPEALAGRRGAQGWILPAAPLDACFFACGVFLWWRFRGVVAIPDGLERLRLGRAPRADEECLVHIRDRGREAQRALYDFTVYGDDGSVLFQVDGYRNVIVAEESAHAV